MTLTKIQIPIEKIYAAINSPDVLNAQATIARNTGGGEALTIHNVSEYTAMNAAVKEVSDAVKLIESARKDVTTPLDNFKKELMKLERESTAPLIEFIEDAKRVMLEYHERLEAEQAAAEAKLKAEAEASLKQAQSVGDIMANFTDRLYATTVENNQTKNVRTTIKARINGEVDWVKVLGLLFASGELDANELIKNLPRAMKAQGVEAIAGIELYEHKTQIIK
jgi:hypothetical protein